MSKLIWMDRQTKQEVTKQVNVEMTRRAKLVIDTAKSGMRSASGLGKTLGGKKNLGTGIRKSSGADDYPSVQTGRLYKSFKVKKIAANRWQIKNTDQKAPLLEFGTKRMKARPFLKNAIRAIFGNDVKIYGEKKGKR